ncbi:hypothetical protein D3C86_1265750 [compost metagenome]
MLSLKLENITRHWLLLLILIVMVGGVGEVKGQRIYADAETHSSPQVVVVTLSQVTNPGRAVDLGDLTNFSTLSATLGALGLIEAWQNVQFTGFNKPVSNTPITIKFGSNTSLLSLLDGVAIQPTLNGVPVGVPYSNATLLALLSALGTPTDAEITLPAPGVTYDGIRLKVSSTLLGLAITNRFYYASFIVAPAVSSTTICSGTTVNLSVTNAQANYTYNWYTSSTGGSPLQSGTSTTFTPSPNLTTTTTFYVEAVQTIGGPYYSARTPVTVTVTPLPTASISGTTSICQSAAAPNITFTGANGTAPYTFTYNINGGSNTTITTTSGNTVTLAVSTGTAGTFNYNLVSIKESSATQCTNNQTGTATVIVNPKPAHPTTSVSSN